METSSRYPWGKGRIVMYSASAAFGAGFVINVTVPARKVWKLIAVTADCICSANAGNRYFSIKLYEATYGMLWMGVTSAVTIANQTCGMDVCFNSAMPSSTTVRRNLADTANVAVYVLQSCPVEYLYAGALIQLEELTGVSATDAATFYVWYIEYDL